MKLVAAVLAGSAVLRDRLVNAVRMDYDGDASDLASLAAAGTGVTDAGLERHRSKAGLDDVASLVYTSGTTGNPKGCEITHGNFALVARNVVAFLPELLLQEQARTLMFHVPAGGSADSRKDPCYRGAKGSRGRQGTAFQHRVGNGH